MAIINIVKYSPLAHTFEYLQSYCPFFMKWLLMLLLLNNKILSHENFTNAYSTIVEFFNLFISKNLRPPSSSYCPWMNFITPFLLCRYTIVSCKGCHSILLDTVIPLTRVTGSEKGMCSTPFAPHYFHCLTTLR